MKIVSSLMLLVLIATLYVSNVVPNIERVWADKVIATIEVGNFPRAFQYNPSNEQVYVANSESNSVSVIDSFTHEVIKTIEVGEYPWAIGYNPSSNKVYTSDRHSDTVSVIDGSTNEVIKTIEVDGSPFAIEYNPVNNYMYISNQDAHTVSVVDGLTNDLVETIEDIYNPQDIVFNPSNDNIYVSSYASNIISVINSSNNDIIKKVGTIGSGPYDLEYDPNNNYIYIGNGNSGDVTVLDTSNNEIIKRIDTGGVNGGPPFYLDSVKYNPYNGYIYVSDGYVNHLSVIDGATNDLIQTIDIGRIQYGSVYNPSNNNIYTALGNGVAIIDSSTNDLIQIVNTTLGPIFAIEYNPSDENVYTANDGSAAVSVISKSSPEVLPPNADAGFDQSVKTNDIVQLDGSNSSDPHGSNLVYDWNQTAGPVVTLSDSQYSNPTFTAPEVNEQTDLMFQLTVTNEEGITSEPDEVIITVNPIATPPPEEEKPRTISDIIRGIIQNPLNVTNSVDSANEIRDILSDNDRNNDQLVCDLIDSEDDYESNIRQILNC